MTATSGKNQNFLYSCHNCWNCSEFVRHVALPEMRDMRLPCTIDNCTRQIDTARHLHEVKNAQ